MKKIGIIGLEGAWSTGQLLDAVKKKTGNAFLVEMDKVYLDSLRKTVFCGDTDLCKFDAFIIKKIGSSYSHDHLNKLEVLRYLEERHNIRMFSAPSKIMDLLNRLSCTITLQANKIPMPPTVITTDRDIACKAVKCFKNVVLKPLYSTKARGMRLISETDDIKHEVSCFINEGNHTMYIQKKINIGQKDYGVVFLGGKYLGTYARVKNADSWNTTINSGGKYTAHKPSSRIIDLAERAQNLFKLDFTSVDIAETDEGIFIFEVSAFGGFRGLMEASGINAAELYTDYVLGELI
jgi:tetrahydromethanopterin:alpha-L-glutamate ligase